MDKQWMYMSNQFENVTVRNFKKALKLSTYHDSALLLASNSDPSFLPLYTAYHSLHLALAQSYAAWKSAGGGQEGETLNVYQLLQLAVNKLNNWDARVQVVYAKTTPRYKAIFTDGRSPFYDGSLETRIAAFNTLSVNIGTDVALASVKTEVDAVFTGLNNARTTQGSAKGDLKALSATLNEDRGAAMKAQYQNVGWVIYNKTDERETVCNILFDQETLRESRQTLFTGALALSQNKAILTHTFMADDAIRLKNTGDAPITFYLASTDGGTNSTAITINVGEEQTVKASDFAVTDYHLHRHLTVINTSNALTSGYVVQLY